MAAETATLVFVRAGGWADALRSYRLFVDGRQVGRIRRNSEVAVPVAAGQREISARIDWCRSVPLTLTLAPGAVQRVEVANTHGALAAGWAIWGAAGRYLSLRVLDGTDDHGNVHPAGREST